MAYVFWLVNLAFVTSIVATFRGRSALNWLAFGLLCPIVALLAAISLSNRRSIWT